MPDALKIENQIRHNPRVNKSQLEQVLEILRKLKKAGIQGAKYDLVTPFSSRPSTPPDDSQDDVHARRLVRRR